MSCLDGIKNHLRDAPLPQVALEVRLTSFEGIFVLNEREVATFGVALAEFLTHHLVLSRQSVNQVGQLRYTEARLVEQVAVRSCC